MKTTVTARCGECEQDFRLPPEKLALLADASQGVQTLWECPQCGYVNAKEHDNPTLDLLVAAGAQVFFNEHDARRAISHRVELIGSDVEVECDGDDLVFTLTLKYRVASSQIPNDDSEATTDESERSAVAASAARLVDAVVAFSRRTQRDR